MTGTVTYNTVPGTNIKYVEDISGNSVAIAIDYTPYLANIASTLASINVALYGDGVHTRTMSGWSNGVSNTTSTMVISGNTFNSTIKITGA